MEELPYPASLLLGDEEPGGRVELPDGLQEEPGLHQGGAPLPGSQGQGGRLGVVGLEGGGGVWPGWRGEGGGNGI